MDGMVGMREKPSRTMVGLVLSSKFKLAKQNAACLVNPPGHYHHFHRGRASTCFTCLAA